MCTAIAHCVRAMATPYISSIVRVFDRGRNFSNAHAGVLKIMVTGCMFGSSISMPVLLSIGARGIEKWTMGIYAISAVTFSSLYHAKLAHYGGYTLSTVTVISILAVVSSKTDLNQVTPYLPLFVALGLSMTAHVAPSVVEYFQQGQNEMLGEQMSIFGRYGQAPSSVAVSLGEPSSRSVASLYPFGIQQWISYPHDFSHMGREMHYATSQPPETENGSDIDLEASLMSETESSSFAEETDPMLTE
ncbi:hypothetical protein BP5796_05906 [Coleophoma crateriformis]|uniref:Uncharacterized protein n=1 Tax=Coleophoma crateriformis TaxID=565419 RepID=A0A3D8RW41_9HELO|nr:hypothetical protein BP5796_05906 [Coleophoma crateriformis]